VRANESMRINDQFYYPALHMDKIELILNFHSSTISLFLNLQDKTNSSREDIFESSFSRKHEFREKLDIQRLYFGGSRQYRESGRV